MVEYKPIGNNKSYKNTCQPRDIKMYSDEMGRNIEKYVNTNKQTINNMKKLDYKLALKSYAEEAVAALFWCDNPEVLVDEENHEVNWLDTEARKSASWKNLWRVLEYYPYTTVVYRDFEKETSEFNFSVGDDHETRGLARLLWNVWFGYVERKYHKADNKTALKIQNRLTNQIVYLGWYDGTFRVSEKPARMLDSWINSVEINED